MALLNARQIPNESILDINGKQTYLGNHFAFPVVKIALTGSSETPQILINNTSSSQGGASAFFNLRRVSSTAQICQFFFYSNPTVTSAGTPQTPINLRTASTTTSLMTCTTAPSISANGTLILSLEAPTDDYVTTDSDLLIILDPGQKLLVTAQPATNTTVNINLAWYELFYGQQF